MYEYKGTIKRVVDGDTVFAEVDLGFHTFTYQSFRLARIDAPERNTPAGIAAAEFVREWEGQPVTIRSSKTDKYGRFLAEIEIIYFGVVPANLSDLLVERGHAKYWDGKGRRPL